MPDIGYYTLPVILSFQGIDKAVDAELGDKLKPAAKQAGQDWAQGMADGVASGKRKVETAADKVVRCVLARDRWFWWHSQQPRAHPHRTTGAGRWSFPAIE